jgi:hypothetical protein
MLWQQRLLYCTLYFVRTKTVRRVPNTDAASPIYPQGPKDAETSFCSAWPGGPQIHASEAEKRENARPALAASGNTRGLSPRRPSYFVLRLLHFVETPMPLTNTPQQPFVSKGKKCSTKPSRILRTSYYCTVLYEVLCTLYFVLYQYIN